jgi:hypothetical protein
MRSRVARRARGVETDGKVEPFEAERSESFDAGGVARGADRQALQRVGEAAAVSQNGDGPADVPEVVERLAHAHEDDVAEAFPRLK